jgi:hypothetical protein
VGSTWWQFACFSHDRAYIYNDFRVVVHELFKNYDSDIFGPTSILQRYSKRVEPRLLGHLHPQLDFAIMDSWTWLQLGAEVVAFAKAKQQQTDAQKINALSVCEKHNTGSTIPSSKYIISRTGV